MRMIVDDKLYLLNSMTMNILNEPLDKSSHYYTSIPFAFHQIFDACQKRDINGSTLTRYSNNKSRYTVKTDIVYFIHHDMWTNSASSFITRRKPNNWPSNSMLENIKSQGCDVVPVGHRDSRKHICNGDICKQSE